MVYPPPPWKLEGFGFQTLHWVNSAPARVQVPSALKVVDLWPGKTLGGVFLASYQAGSVLEYNELIVVSALVYSSGKLGFWISHIYVDSPDSMAGGRQIWGLPKELAEFTWSRGEEQGSVIVRQQGRSLCSLSYNRQTSLWLPALTASAFSVLEGRLLCFQATLKAEAKLLRAKLLRAKLLRAKLNVPADSPFANLDLGQPWLAVDLEPLDLVVAGPQPP